MDPRPRRLSRASAARLVAVIALATLALNLWELRAALPAVLHSDYVQAGQAVDLLRDGSFEDRATYPPPLVYAYAAADLAAFAVGRVLGWDGYADWPGFVQHLAQPQVHHAIGRALGAVCAALLAVGTYRLARVRFDRRASVLAAAAASFSPLQTIYAHQLRPHVPVIALVVLVAPAVLRAALAPSLRRGLLSGLAAGIASAVLQVGLPFAGAAFALVALFARPVRVALAALLGLGFGFVAGWFGLFHLSTVMLTEGGREAGILMRGEAGSLGYGRADIFSDLGRFPMLGTYWLAAEVICALALLGFLLLAVARRRSWRDLLLYGIPAIAMPVGMCLLHPARPRYMMYATPFLAPLAASACLAIPQTVLRRLASGLLVLVPLASSARQDLLLGRSDTRIANYDSLPSLAGSGLNIVVQADLLPALVGVPTGISLFPPHANYRIWLRNEETVRQTMLRLRPDVFVHGGDGAGLHLEPADLRLMGLVPAFQIGGPRAFVPGEPEWVLPELWLADRPGPQIECLAREEFVERVRALQSR